MYITRFENVTWNWIKFEFKYVVKCYFGSNSKPWWSVQLSGYGIFATPSKTSPCGTTTFAEIKSNSTVKIINVIILLEFVSRFTLNAVQRPTPTNHFIIGSSYIFVWGWYVSIRAGNFSVRPARLASWGRKLFTALGPLQYFRFYIPTPLLLWWNTMRRSKYNFNCF